MGWQVLQEDWVVFMSIAMMLALIFGTATFARVRRAGLGERAKIAIAIAVACAPGLLAFERLSRRRPSSSDAHMIEMGLAGCLVIVPVVLEITDALERRLQRRASA